MYFDEPDVSSLCYSDFVSGSSSWLDLWPEDLQREAAPGTCPTVGVESGGRPSIQSVKW